MREIHRLIVHHSASQRTTTLADVRSWHLARGFVEVGYHFFVDGSGAIQRGRDLDQVGAHAKGANSDSIGICVAGNNTVAADRWAAQQTESLRRLCRALQTAFGSLEIQGHRWARGGTTATECPGLTREEWEALESTLH